MPDPIAQAVRAEMERRGITQTKLEAMSGMDQGQISQWFAGKRDPRVSSACKVLAALEMLDRLRAQ